MLKIYSFNKQKRHGIIGQDAFQKYYPESVVSDDRAYDFLLDNKKIEVKTDFYDKNIYGNYFIETISNSNKKTLGSIFRAADDKVDYFVYFFIKNAEFHWFEVKSMLKLIKKLIKKNKYKKKIVRNKNYDTFGVLIPIKDLEDIIIKVDRF